MHGLIFIGEVLVLFLYAVVISLPGIGVAYVGWRSSREWHSLSAQTLFRASLIAVAVTPSIWGHAGILPAILLTLLLHGREKLAGIVPILAVYQDLSASSGTCHNGQLHGLPTSFSLCPF